MYNFRALSRLVQHLKVRRLFACVLILAVVGTVVKGQSAAQVDVSQVRARAERADPEAQNALGNIYAQGLLGITADSTEAVAWYRKAAERGFAPGQFNLGLAYEEGRGVEANPQEAARFYLLAAEQGFGPAQFNLGNLYAAGKGVAQDLFEANLWYKQAAEKGVVEAQFNLGLAYEAGRGVKKDEAQAARWYKQAADRGYARAQYNLGLLLEDGRGVPKNEVSAAAYYRASAEQNFAPAQTNYGIMLSEGRGGLRADLVEAYVWLSLAAKNGSSPAGRDYVARSMSAEQIVTGNRIVAERSGATTVETTSAGELTLRADDPATAARVAELTAALERLRDANAQYAEANQRLEFERAHLAQQIAQGSESGRLVEQLHEQIRSLTARVESLDSEKEKARREATVLAAQLKEAQASMRERREPTEITELPHSELARLQAENGRLVARIGELENQPVAADPSLASRLEEVQSTVTRLAAQLSVLAEEKSELEAWAQTLEKSQNEKTAEANLAKERSVALQAKLAEAEQRFSEADATVLAQRDALQNAQEARAAMNELKAQLSDAEKKLAANATSIQSLTAELGAAKQSASRAVAADADALEKLRLATANLTALQTQNAQLSQRVSELESAPKPVVDDSAARRLTAAQARVATLEGEIGLLRQHAAAGASDGDALRAENLRLTAKIAELEPLAQAAASAKAIEQQLANAETRIAALTEELRAAQTMGSGSAANVEALTEKLASVTANFEQSTAALASVQRDLGELREDKVRLSARVAELEQQPSPDAGSSQLAEKLAQAQQQLKAATDKASADRTTHIQALARIASLEADLRIGQRKATGGTGEFDALKKQFADTGSALERSNAELVRVQSELVAVRQGAADAAALAAQNAQLTARVAELEQAPKAEPTAAPRLAQAQAEVLAATAKIAALEDELRAVQERAQGSSAELEGLRHQLATATQSLEATRARVSELTASNAELQTEARRARDEVANELAQSRQQVATLETKLASATQVAAEVPAMKTSLVQVTEALSKARRENERLNERIGALQEKPVSLVDDTSVARLAEAQARLDAVERELQIARQNAAGVDEFKRQLDESNQAIEKSEATVAELTGLNERLEQDVAAARAAASRDAVVARTQLDDVQRQLAELKQSTGDVTAIRNELAALRADAAGMASLREENERLRHELGEASSIRTQFAQLTRDHAQLTATVTVHRSNLEQAQTQVAQLEKQLLETRALVSQRGAESQKLQADLAEANQTVEELTATVAELTGINDLLEQDLESSKKSLSAALAAQAQALSATQPDAYKMEISILNAQIKDLEGRVEEERSATAKEFASLALQLQRAREANRSLNEANRSLMAAQQAEVPMVNKAEFDELQTRSNDLIAVGEELRRQIAKLNSENQRLSSERADLRQQLADARQVATVLPGLAEEKAALEDQLEVLSNQLANSRRELDGLQKASGETTAQLLASQQLAQRTASELAALRALAAEAEKAAENHHGSVAELTELNTRLEAERVELIKQLAAARAEQARIAQNVNAVEQLKAEADRSAQQNIDTLSAQLAQVRRELQTAREINTRISETNAAQERERAAALTQLRQENTALVARLTQAQGTLDQIASAARLATPASVLASGGNLPPLSATAAGTPTAVTTRYHTVVEGDSLSRMSLRYYGTANRWQEIFQANREVLQGSSTLRVGTQLRIP